jgi:hypothetical protein
MSLDVHWQVSMIFFSATRVVASTKDLSRKKRITRTHPKAIALDQAGRPYKEKNNFEPIFLTQRVKLPFKVETDFCCDHTENGSQLQYIGHEEIRDVVHILFTVDMVSVIKPKKKAAIPIKVIFRSPLKDAKGAEDDSSDDEDNGEMDQDGTVSFS